MVPFSPQVRYLGVELDCKLHWKIHIESKIVSAKRLIMSLCNLTSNSLGPCPKLMKWAYEGIVKPMFTYAALVWAHEINTDVLQDKLRKLNRLAMNTFCLTPKSVSTKFFFFLEFPSALTLGT